MSSKLIPLFDSGQFDEAIGLAVGQAEHLADNEIWLRTWFAAMRVKILAVRGQAAAVADTLDWLETTIRESESSQHIVFGLGSAALARAALEQNDRAAALLAEIEANPALVAARTTPTPWQRWCAPLSRRPTRNSRNEW